MANRKPRTDQLKSYQFKPGHPGGPGRRPNIFGPAYEKALSETIPKDKKRRKFIELLAKAMVQEAIAGKNSVLAAKELADRIEGRPAQAVTGEAGGPMRVHVTIERIGGGDDEE